MGETRRAKAARLLESHKRNTKKQCQSCTEPHASAFDALIDAAIESGEEVSLVQLWNALREWTGYSRSLNALQKCLRDHRDEQKRKLNLFRRGRLE